MPKKIQLHGHLHTDELDSRKLAEWIEESTGKEVRAQRGWEYLLYHSPELQPAERLWSLTNEGMANRFFQPWGIGGVTGEALLDVR